MKSRKSLLACLILVFTLLACTPRQANVPSSPPGEDSGFNLLVVIEGEVKLKRTSWSGFHPTAFGAALQRGDQLQLTSGARAVVLCDNLSTWPVPSGAPSGLNGCPPPDEPALVRPEGTIGSTRGGNDPLIPYIISPRSTKLLSGTPTLRWNLSPGATQYTVRIKGDGLNWENEVSDTEMTYSGKPPLEPGTTYLLIVEADNGKLSQDEGVPGIGFSMLTENESQNARNYTERLTKLNLPDEAEAYALAQLYAGQGLMAEAIETLEALVQADSQAAAVYRVLGNFYQKIGLALLAEPRYRRAIELSEASGDADGLAMAQASLGIVYATLGNEAEASYWLEQSKAGFNALGDKKHVSEIEKQLDDLSP